MDSSDWIATGAVSDRRRALDQRVTGWANPMFALLARHWLALLNIAVALFLLGAFAAPLLAAAGSFGAANALYDFYHAACHQWAFRSFFIGGSSAVYDQATLAALGADPFTYIGSPSMGWKMAFCERDLAIFSGALFFGVVYGARWRRLHLPLLSYRLYALLILPMALDGFTQLFAWRESTWELRVATGLLFGVASAWLLYPRFEESIVDEDGV